jgi:uncharacterized protein YndB with AHSA1/START domain
VSRVVEKTVTIDAPPDVVWRALTEADELTRWFPVDARVKPGLGGSIWLSWGGGIEGEAPITGWESGRHLQWTEARGAVKIAVDFHLEAKGGTTVVRLVQSGFGDGPDWDEEFHMVDGGWSYFMQHLRWYLERHRGVPRAVTVFREAVTLTRAEALQRLLGPAGLSSDGSLLSAASGAPYVATTSAGDRISGTVVAAKYDTGQVGLTISELGNAMLFLEMEPAPEGVKAAMWLSTYGLDVSELADVRRRFEGLYRNALQIEVGAGS